MNLGHNTRMALRSKTEADFFAFRRPVMSGYPAFRSPVYFRADIIHFEAGYHKIVGTCLELIQPFVAGISIFKLSFKSPHPDEFPVKDENSFRFYGPQHLLAVCEIPEAVATQVGRNPETALNQSVADN